MLSEARIAVLQNSPHQAAKARKLAERLSLPLVCDQQTEVDYWLVVAETIHLQERAPSKREIHVDFLTKQWQYRQKKATLKNEALAKALGLKRNTRPSIVDATGGLGHDSLIVASLGYPMIVLERSSIIFTLLMDGIERASAYHEAVKRLTVIQADAIVWLKNNPPPDLIYLDPMFPEKRKSALAKKQMQWFQQIIGQDLDADLLFETALACARQRVVVKRPRLAGFITEKKPSYSLTGRSSRFDIYLK